MSTKSQQKPPDLRGTWRIRRRIFGEDARFSGTCRIGADGHYHEDGVLTRGAYSGPAFCDYVYERDGQCLRILFAGGAARGRVFLSLEFSFGAASGVHHCGADVYEAWMRVDSRRWLTAYRVRGPRKNYSIVSVMTRVS